MVSVQIGPVAQETVLENLDGAVVAADGAAAAEIARCRELVFDQPERLIPNPYSCFGWSPIT
jgi:hypothetical protein